jgi:hypothetical protein
MIIENYREYLEKLIRDGYTVRHDEHGSDPDLIDPGGNPIETWRVDYPYEERIPESCLWTATCTRKRNTPSK